VYALRYWQSEYVESETTWINGDLQSAIKLAQDMLVKGIWFVEIYEVNLVGTRGNEAPKY
jgi:hypothetical protein